MIRFGVIIFSAAIPVIITIFNLYNDHRLSDIIAHFSSGVAIGAVVGVVFGMIGVLGISLGVALLWEWVEPRLQTVFGPLEVGYEDTVGDVLAVVLGSVLIHLAL